MSLRQPPPAAVPYPAPEPDADDTVRLPPRRVTPAPPPRNPLLTSRRAWIAGASLLGVACLARGLGPLVLSHRHPPLAGQTQTGAQPSFAIRTATEQTILNNVPTGLSVFRFADDERVLVLDFASLEQQGLMLNRVAALIEKAGTPRNQVLNDTALMQAISASGDTVATYYYGHDYSAASLQRFFAAADSARVRLDPQEENLRLLLRQAGWFAAGTQGGLISIPATGASPNVNLAARAAILHHELSHGLFFSDPEYADFVHDFWQSALTGDERSNVRRFLGSEGYDTSYEELMYNEMQAYLMFTRDPRFFTPARVGMTPRRLAMLQGQFLRNMPTGWLRDALAATPVVLTDASP